MKLRTQCTETDEKIREEEIWSVENRQEHREKKIYGKCKKQFKRQGHGEKSNVSTPNLGRGNKKIGKK